MSRNTNIPVGTFLAQQGNVNLGQFTGLALGSGLVAAAQGTNLAMDVAPGDALTDAELRASPLPVLVTPPTVATRTSVAASAVDVLLLAANALRTGATVFNESVGATLYLALGTAAASTVSYTVQLSPGAYFEVPFSFTGQIRGIWSAASGAARISEVTP